jgi:hypothetical protein
LAVSGASEPLTGSPKALSYFALIVARHSAQPVQQSVETVEKGLREIGVADGW